MILQLQNHMGFGIRWSWRVSKKNSKLPSWRGLQKNHAQLQHFPRKSLLKFFRRRNFKIIMLTSEWSYPLGEASRKIMLNFNFTKDFPVNWKCHEFGSGQISKSPSCAVHMSFRSSKQSKPSKRSRPVRASKETQIKAKRASMCASKACRAKPITSHG